MYDNKRTDSKVRRDVERLSRTIIIEEKSWRMVLEIAFKDIYANYICMGKDVPYRYFIHTAAQALKLINNNEYGH